MRALTLWQPMAWAISDYTKRIENRPWEPWPRIIGHQIAIHAGKHYELAHKWQIERKFEVRVPDRGECVQGAIVAVARVVGFVRKARDNPDKLARNLWFSGPVGWLLEDAVKVKPIACAGALGLWQLPEAVEAELMAQLIPGWTPPSQPTQLELGGVTP